MTEKSEGTELSESGAQQIVRGHREPVRLALFWLGAAVSLLHIYFNTWGTWPELWTKAMHFGSFGLLCALYYPLIKSRRAADSRILLGIDVVLGLAAVGAVIYLIFAEDAIHNRGIELITTDWIVGIAAILLAIEFARRATGWIIPVLIIVAIGYPLVWGNLVPEPFHFPSGKFQFQTFLFRGFYSDEGLFSPIARISSSDVFMFVLFGAFLTRAGAVGFIIEFARATVGRVVGGEGFVAVMASGMMGTVSGSAAANTAATGTLTIPMMKGAGFPARFAAGVEAGASTGGQLMPPIMGAGAFIMVNYTGIPYGTIIAAAALPAILYFLSVAFWVRIEAKRYNIKVDKKDIPGFMDVLRKGTWISFFVPIAVLVGLLIDGRTPTFAAGFAIIAVVLGSWLSSVRMGPKAVLEALAKGAQFMIPIGILLVSVGLIIMVINLTGVGQTVAQLIQQWAGGHLFIAIALIALASLVLGMGLPVTAAYAVTAPLVAAAIQGMINEVDLTNLLMAGQVPEAASVFLKLFAPEHAASIGQPMSAELAQTIIDKVPPGEMAKIIGIGLPEQMVIAATLSAHMIIFWLSQDSNVTPPVCLVAFVAAGIAGAPPMRTGFTAWMISKGLYIMPLLFAYTPFLTGDFVDALRIFIFGVFGIYAITAAIEGRMEAPERNWIIRGVLFATGVALLWPDTGWIINGGGLAILLILLTLNVLRDRRTAKQAA